jgi:hypothetical protein
MSEKRSEILSIRFTASERRRIAAITTERDRPVARWLRRLILTALCEEEARLARGGKARRHG